MHYRMISVQIFVIIIILYHELLKKSRIPSSHVLLFVHSSELECSPQPSLAPCLPIYIPNGLAMHPSGKTHNLNTSVSSHSVPVSLPRQLGQRDEEGGNVPLCLKLAGLTSQTLFYVVVTLIYPLLALISISQGQVKEYTESAGFVLSYLTVELLQLPVHSKTFPMASLYLRKLPPKAFLLGFICFLILHELISLNSHLWQPIILLMMLNITS